MNRRLQEASTQIHKWNWRTDVPPTIRKFEATTSPRDRNMHQRRSEEDDHRPSRGAPPRRERMGEGTASEPRRRERRRSVAPEARAERGRGEREQWEWKRQGSGGAGRTRERQHCPVMGIIGKDGVASCGPQKEEKIPDVGPTFCSCPPTSWRGNRRRRGSATACGARMRRPHHTLDAFSMGRASTWISVGPGYRLMTRSTQWTAGKWVHRNEGGNCERNRPSTERRLVLQREMLTSE